MQRVRDPSKEDLDCTSHNQPVDSYALIPDVIEILVNIQMQGYAVAVMDLPPAGDAGLDQKTEPLPRFTTRAIPVARVWGR